MAIHASSVRVRRDDRIALALAATGIGKGGLFGDGFGQAVADNIQPCFQPNCNSKWKSIVALGRPLKALSLQLLLAKGKSTNKAAAERAQRCLLAVHLPVLDAQESETKFRGMRSGFARDALNARMTCKPCVISH